MTKRHQTTKASPPLPGLKTSLFMLKMLQRVLLTSSLNFFSLIHVNTGAQTQSKEQDEERKCHSSCHTPSLLRSLATINFTSTHLSCTSQTPQAHQHVQSDTSVSLGDVVYSCNVWGWLVKMSHYRMNVWREVWLWAVMTISVWVCKKDLQAYWHWKKGSEQLKIKRKYGEAEN